MSEGNVLCLFVIVSTGLGHPEVGVPLAEVGDATCVLPYCGGVLLIIP